MLCFSFPCLHPKHNRMSTIPLKYRISCNAQNPDRTDFGADTYFGDLYEKKKNERNDSYYKINSGFFELVVKEIFANTSISENFMGCGCFRIGILLEVRFPIFLLKFIYRCNENGNMMLIFIYGKKDLPFCYEETNFLYG